jgi:hypothetical protein
VSFDPPTGFDGVPQEPPAYPKWFVVHVPEAVNNCAQPPEFGQSRTKLFDVHDTVE